MIFQIIAIAELIAFYGCYFVKLLSQKRKGIQTNQIGKGKTGIVKFIEITMKLAAIAVFAIGLASIITGINRSHFVFRIIGAAIGIVGTVVFIISVLTMHDSWRAGVPKYDKTRLVTNGIYQISRNPAFLGFDLLYIGILMMFFNTVLCALSVFAIAMYHLQIVKAEEPFLQATFGNEYLNYKKKVCRYIGRKLQIQY